MSISRLSDNNKKRLKRNIKTNVSRYYHDFKYHTYTPSYGAEGLPVLVAVHGISHRAKEQARAFLEYAERYGFVVVAPLFGRKEFPAYQRLGVSNQSIPCYSDMALNSILDEVSEQTGALTEKVYLFGYSAGGQFAHRFAMAYPDKVHAVVAGAAGWYTFPNTNITFPQGLAHRVQSRTIEFDRANFLRIPMATFVGENDNQSDTAFKRSKRLDLQQGVTRIERAEHWINAMRNAANLYGFDTPYECQIIKSCGHSFIECVNNGNLAFKTVDFLLKSTRYKKNSDRFNIFDGQNQQNKYRIA